MGKTVPSYRMTIEFEISRWKSFRNALANDEEKLAFDQVMDMCRGLASAGSAACSPIIFEPMAMSILVNSAKENASTRKRKILLQAEGEMSKAMVKIQTRIIRKKYKRSQPAYERQTTPYRYSAWQE